MNWQDFVQKWLKTEKEPGRLYSYRSIAEAAGVSKNIVWRLGTAQQAQPMHDDGEKLKTTFRRLTQCQKI